jgi:hypothetical protein
MKQAPYPTEYEQFFVAKTQEKGNAFSGLGSPERQEGIQKYGWAVPNDDAIGAIRRLSPIIEVGAGKGYWASELSKFKVDIIATDMAPPPIGERWTRVHRLDAVEAARRHADRTLLTIWPSYLDAWPRLMLEAYVEAGGMRVAYIGEGHYGCTADDRFHEILKEHFTRVQTVRIPTWPDLHDHLTIWMRKESP